MNLTAIFALSTLGLAAALYCCYRNGKPLREKAAKEAKEKHEREERDRKATIERQRHDENRKDFLGFLTDVIQNPSRLRGLRPDYPHSPTAYGPIVEFFNQFQDLRTRQYDNQHLHKVTKAQAERIKALEGQLKDIQQALRMGQPIEE